MVFIPVVVDLCIEFQASLYNAFTMIITTITVIMIIVMRSPRMVLVITLIGGWGVGLRAQDVGSRAWGFRVEGSKKV